MERSSSQRHGSGNSKRSSRSSERLLVEDETADDQSRTSRKSRRSQSTRNFGSGASVSNRRRVDSKAQSSRTLGGTKISKTNNSQKLDHHGSSGRSVSSKRSRKHNEVDKKSSHSRSSRKLLEGTRNVSLRPSSDSVDSFKSFGLLEEEEAPRRLKRIPSTDSIDTFKSFDLELDVQESVSLDFDLDLNSSDSSVSLDLATESRGSGKSFSSKRNSAKSVSIKIPRGTSFRGSGKSVASRRSTLSIDEDSVLHDSALHDSTVEGLLNMRTQLSNLGFLENDRKGRQNRTSGSSVTSRRSARSTVTVKERMEADEAFLLYTRTEKAALQIQQAFRKKHPEMNPAGKPDDDNTKGPSESSLSVYSTEKVTKDEGDRDKTQWYTALFFGAVAFVQLLTTFLSGCARCFGKGSDGDDEIAAAANNAAVEGGGVGGGGGGEAAQGAQGPAQAMAGQAASAAGSAASSGVAAAGAAAAAAAGAAAAGGFAAAASAVGVTAAVATVAGVAAVIVTSSGGNNTVVSEATTIVSSCGLVNPTVRPARVSFLMEGFTEEFDERESLLLESLLVEAYNNITVGDGCSDEFLRELNGAKLVDQVVFPANEVNNSIVETTFETVLFCDGCPEVNPMFGGFADNEDLRRNLRQNSLPRRLETMESFQFFQEFIQVVLVGVKQLSDDAEISDEFIQLAKGYITDIKDENGNDNGSGGGSGEGGSNGGSGGGGGSGGSGASGGSGGGGGSGQSLVTTVNAVFNAAGEISALTFEFTVDGEKIVTTVNVAPATDAPTVTPTLFPTDQPSFLPSVSQMPSMTNATYAPTDTPSSEPSEGPSTNPSSEPSTNPSSQPSMLPSVIPSALPSVVPSDMPSAAPSESPSESPSDVPSLNPSSQPSALPSTRPSAVPSLVPSIIPTLSMVPSDVPSQVPSFQPSPSPTRTPSSRPTMFPTISIRPTPCIWTAAERIQSKIGNGPDANCTGIDYLSRWVPVHIIDQSQDGESVTFRLQPRLFASNISSLAAMTYPSAGSTSTCNVQTTATFDNRRSYTGDCTNGELEVTFYLFMCGSENNVNQTTSTFCETPSEMDDYYEYRYKLDCWEKCETEGPTSGPTSGPTVSLRPTSMPSATPSSAPSPSPTNRPTVSAAPSKAPTKVPTGP
ncbi:unnamed protein product [Cylindrotheca closterium]|uniref:Circumsporozoite protein n=1 Tax=Cylindrotheca closterium TaxID=2856 RepID=A0AAD2PUW5_9STRA|nr:unnamed protein product [Cylindrotheca closterium]